MVLAGSPEKISLRRASHLSVPKKKCETSQRQIASGRAEGKRLICRRASFINISSDALQLRIFLKDMFFLRSNAENDPDMKEYTRKVSDELKAASKAIYCNDTIKELMKKHLIEPRRYIVDELRSEESILAGFEHPEYFEATTIKAGIYDKGSVYLR